MTFDFVAFVLGAVTAIPLTLLVRSALQIRRTNQMYMDLLRRWDERSRGYDTTKELDD